MIRKVGLAVCVTALLAGCGGSGEANTATQPPPQATGGWGEPLSVDRPPVELKGARRSATLKFSSRKGASSCKASVWRKQSEAAAVIICTRRSPAKIGLWTGSKTSDLTFMGYPLRGPGGGPEAVVGASPTGRFVVRVTDETNHDPKRPGPTLETASALVNETP